MLHLRCYVGRQKVFSFLIAKQIRCSFGLNLPSPSWVVVVLLTSCGWISAVWNYQDVWMYARNARNLNINKIRSIDKIVLEFRRRFFTKYHTKYTIFQNLRYWFFFSSNSRSHLSTLSVMADCNTDVRWGFWPACATKVAEMLPDSLSCFSKCCLKFPEWL